MATMYMSAEAPDRKAWLADRLRGTNWAAAGLSAVLQGGFLLMIISMGVASITPEPKRERVVMTITTSSEQQPAAPAPPRPDQPDKPAVQPRADVVMPPVATPLSSAPPVAAAPERAPDPPAPAAAPAAPAAAAPAAAAGPAGPTRVANIGANLNCSPPSYPAKARSEKQEGTVIVDVAVSAEGRITQASLRRSSGFGLLDEAALAAVRKCRGSPRMQNGRAVDITGAVNIPFTLRKS